MVSEVCFSRFDRGVDEPEERSKHTPGPPAWASGTACGGFRGLGRQARATTKRGVRCRNRQGLLQQTRQHVRGPEDSAGGPHDQAVLPEPQRRQVWGTALNEPERLHETV